MPNIPNITPVISLNRCETINLLLSSIALEEIGLSHLLNAEGEKLQYVLEQGCESEDIWKVNDSVNATLRSIIKSQMLLQFKLEDVVVLNKDSGCDCQCEKKRKHCSCCGADCTECLGGVDDLRCAHCGCARKKKHHCHCSHCQESKKRCSQHKKNGHVE